MGSANAIVSSCLMDATGVTGTTAVQKSYLTPTGTTFAIIVRGKACESSGANGATARITRIEVYTAPSTPSIQSFTVEGIVATIDEDNKTITAELPNGTDLSNLEPSVVIGGSATSYSPTGAQDFTNPVTYTVTDGTNNVDYTVTLTVPTTPRLYHEGGIKSPFVQVNTAMEDIVYRVGGTATTASISWTGTASSTTSPDGISVDFTSPNLTISGTPTTLGEYSYTVTTDGTPAASDIGTITVSKYKIGDYISVTNGNWDTPDTWNVWSNTGWTTTTAFPNSNSADVYIKTGTVVSHNANAIRNLNNLFVEGTLNSGTLVNTARFLGVFGDIYVESTGVIGDIENLNGNSSSGISISTHGTSTQTISGDGIISVSRLRINSANSVIIDADMNINYHGSSNGGNAAALYPVQSGSTVTINEGKTVTMDRWASIYLNTSSGALQAYNFTLNINGTLDFLPGSPDDENDRTLLKSYLSANTSGNSNNFAINVGTNGVLTVNEFYPNGNSLTNTATGSTTIVNNGIFNVRLTAEFNRNPEQIVAGTGTFNLLDGAEIIIGNTIGINNTSGHIQTTNVNYGSDVIFTYAGSAAQITGDDLPASVGALNFQNDKGVTFSQNVTADEINIIPSSKGTIPESITIYSEALNIKSDDTGTATLVNLGTFSGTANVEQHLASVRNWYVSSPVSSTSLTGMNYIDHYDETSGWVQSTGTEFPTLAAGKGYLINPVEAGNITFSGTLNGENLSIPITRSDATNLRYQGFNLIGNPYPAFLNAAELVNENNENIEQTVWYRTHNGSAYEYQTYNAPAGITVPEAENGQYIAPMQAVWIRSAVPSANLTISRSWQLHNPDGLSIPFRAPKAASNKILRIILDNGSSKDEAVIFFHPNAQNGYDKYDSPKMLNNTDISPNIFTQVGTEKLVINGMNTIPYDAAIPLTIEKVKNVTNYTLSNLEFSNFEISDKVFLIDRKLNTFVELNKNSYPFIVESDENLAERFAIEFTKSNVPTSVDNPELVGFAIYTIGKKISISLNEKQIGENISIYNNIGQLLHSEIANNQKIDINRNLQPGIYIVKIKNHSIKVVIK